MSSSRRLVVHPVEHQHQRGVGWTSTVEIAEEGDLRAVPFLRLTLAQPLYADPPRDVTAADKVAALGEAFASLLFARFHDRPRLASTSPRASSPPAAAPADRGGR